MENFANAVLRSCTSYKQNESVRNALNRTVATNATNQSLNPKLTAKTSTQLFQDNNNEIEATSIRSISSVSEDTDKINEDQVEEIQECRQNTGREEATAVSDYEEFSDCPTFPSLMDISDIMFTSDCESTKNITIQTKRPNKRNPKSVTKKNFCDLPNQAKESDMLIPQSSVIYCSRSENDSDSEYSTISHNDVVNPNSQTLKLPQHEFVTPQVPMKNFQKTTSVTKCHVSTTATSIITQRDRVVHHEEFVVNLAGISNTPLNLSQSCSRATKTTTTIVKEKKEISLNNSCRTSANITALTPKSLNQESSNLLTTYKDNLNFELEQMETNISKNSASVYIKKICDVGESMVNEIERERKSLLELEGNAERLARQLGWQYEAYQRRTQQFECFKRNVETLLRVLSDVNLLEEVQIDTENKIQQLQQTSNSITKHNWRNFINETTENLLKDLSSLSDL
ncbi:uncharacterized protein LOC118746126 [Rhagoletis pomonella]|uniref:uncharacterized protein LOC118746126 n=1 Tax=Rhagoletis pomonella TaxID=28610 RepID=UPI00177DB5C7|nr:uncharacterized protein LOC118746126 [Rhagoletis pomonella]